MRVKQEFKYANLLFTGTIVFMTLMSVLGVTAIVKSLAGGDDYIVRVTVAQAYLIIPVIIYLVFCRKYLNDRECSAMAEVMARTGFRLIGPVKILLSFVTAAAFIPFLTFINQLSLTKVKDVTTENAMESAASYPFAVMFIFIAVIPALVEESIFRGIYYHVYKKAGNAVGIVVSTLFFALMHSNLNQFAYALIAGLCFSVFVNLAGSILYSLLIHIIINGTSVFIFYAERFGIKLPRYFTESHHGSVGEVFRCYFLPALIGFLVMAICCFILYYMKKSALTSGKIKEVGPELQTKSFKEAFLAVTDQAFFAGVAIMVLNMIAIEFMK